MPGAARVSGGRKMRVKPSSEAGACRPSALCDKRLGAMARWSAILLSGTAAVALSMGQPASAIVINDQVAAARTITMQATSRKPVQCWRLGVHRLADQFTHDPDRGPLLLSE